jgi:hypothetical protein
VCLVDSLDPRGRSNRRRWRSSSEEKKPRNEGEVTMTESGFDPTYPQELQTSEFWEEVILDAQAERLLRRMDEGRIEPPGAWTSCREPDDFATAATGLTSPLPA